LENIFLFKGINGNWGGGDKFLQELVIFLILYLYIEGKTLFSF
jgi:hypothetical protein